MNAREPESVQLSTNNKVFVSVLLLAHAIPIAFVISGLTSLYSNPILDYLRPIIASIMFLGLAVWGLRKEKIPFDAIGLNLQKLKEAIVLVLVGWAIVALVKYLAIVAGNGDLGELFGNPPLSILQQWVFVGIAEEVLFRGYILTRLTRLWITRNKVAGLVCAVTITSLLFATAHMPHELSQVVRGEMTLGTVFVSAVLKLIPGIAFSYLFLRTKSVLLVGLIHGSLNVPLVGIGEDVFPLIIVVIPYVEVFLFLRHRMSRKVLYAEGEGAE